MITLRLRDITPLLFIGMMSLFVSCSKSYTKNEQLEFNGKFPDESAKAITIVYSDSGKVTFELSAPVLNTYKGDNAYMDCPQGITITSYDDFGEKQSRMTADYAISNDKTQFMEARKNVVIVDLKKNEKIETEQIIWDQMAKKIYSNVQVRQTKADSTINIGDGFVADERFTKYTVFRPVCEALVDAQ
ncbi:MAG: LPS export ABC transporter periplasmic protein LptC [Bacteroidales bacterium]|jgi:LPS export ABC transporter protein LptC|nr:LPS export ABC transporter periplasmic protein LptC [Bacteroidales bacterium]